MTAFDNIQSPVVRVVSAAVHFKFTSIWRDVRVQNAEEIYHWGQVYDQVLERTLFQLSQRARNSEYQTEMSNDIWKIQSIPLENLVGSMMSSYTRKFGQPQWISSEKDLMMLIRTFDSCSSRPINAFHPSVWPGVEGFDMERSDHVHIAMRFDTEHAVVRRYMRQIVVDPSHKYVNAGSNLELPVSLWDPHQSLAQMKNCTVFSLVPEVPWLNWDSASGSFVGRVPFDLAVQRENKGFPMKLDLGLVARTVDGLPQGVKRETTVRANVCIWVYEPEEDDRLFDTFRKGQYKSRHCSVSTCGIDGSHQHPSPVSTATVGKTSTPKMAPIQAKKPKKARTPVFDENSYDTDLSGSEACFVSTMQSNMIPGLGSCTRLLDSVRAQSPTKSRPRKMRSETVETFNPAIHEDPHAGISHEKELPSPPEFQLDSTEQNKQEKDGVDGGTQRSRRDMPPDPRLFERYLQQSLPKADRSYYVVPPPTESDSGTVHRQGANSDTSSIFNGYTDSIAGDSTGASIGQNEPSGTMSGRKTRRGGDYDMSDDTSVEWEFLMKRGKENISEDESVDVGDLTTVMKMKEEDWCMSSKLSVTTEDDTYQFDRKDLRH